MRLSLINERQTDTKASIDKCLYTAFS